MTGTLSTPTTGQPNATEDPKTASAVTALNNVLTASNQLDGAAIGAGTIPSAAINNTGILDADLASPNNSTYKTVLTVCSYLGAIGTGTYIFNSGSSVNQNNGATTAATPPVLWDYTAGDYAVAGLTTKFRVKMEVVVGATSPSTVTLQAGLSPLSVVAGGNALGTVATGSTTGSPAPALTTNAISRYTSGDFAASALSSDPGTYALQLIVGSIQVPAGIYANVQLQTHNV